MRLYRSMFASILKVQTFSESQFHIFDVYILCVYSQFLSHLDFSIYSKCNEFTFLYKIKLEVV